MPIAGGMSNADACLVVSSNGRYRRVGYCSHLVEFGAPRLVHLECGMRWPDWRNRSVAVVNEGARGWLFGCEVTRASHASLVIARVIIWVIVPFL